MIGVAVDCSDVGVLPSGFVVGPLPGYLVEVLVSHALAVLGRDHHVGVLGGPRAAVLGEVLALFFGPLAPVVPAAVGLLDEPLLLSRVLDLAPLALAGGLHSLLALLAAEIRAAGYVAGAPGPRSDGSRVPPASPTGPSSDP